MLRRMADKVQPECPNANMLASRYPCEAVGYSSDDNDDGVFVCLCYDLFIYVLLLWKDLRELVELLPAGQWELVLDVGSMLSESQTDHQTLLSAFTWL